MSLKCECGGGIVANHSNYGGNIYRCQDCGIEIDIAERCEKAEALLADRDNALQFQTNLKDSLYVQLTALQSRVEAVSEVVKNRCEHCGVYKSDKCTGELCTFFDILNLLKEPKEAE